MQALGIDWDFLDDGMHSAAYVSDCYPGKVLVVSKKSDLSKSLLVKIGKAKHLPHIEQVLDLSDKVGYLMPKYRVGEWGVSFSKHNENQYDILEKLSYKVDTGDYNRDALPSDLSKTILFSKLDKSLQESLLVYFNLVESVLLENDALSFLFDIKRQNIAEDENGDLILLDIFYIYYGRIGRGKRK